MQGKVEIAGVNTAKLKVLKSSETMELLRRSKAGDTQARQELIEGNLRLVLSVIQRFAGRGESVDDLFQVGCVGLIKAIDNFDVNQPVKFSTYGVPMIVGEIRRYLRDNSAIRVVPLHAGHRLSGASGQRTAYVGKSEGAYRRADRQSTGYSAGGSCVRHGRHRRPGFPV